MCVCLYACGEYVCMIGEGMPAENHVAGLYVIVLALYVCSGLQCMCDHGCVICENDCTVCDRACKAHTQP